MRAESSQSGAVPPHTPVAGWEWIVVAGVAALAALLRWVEIAQQGLWLDEAFSVWMARQPARDLLHWVSRIDQHPPLYYLLLRGWMLLTGDGEAAVRALSLLFGVATVPVVYLLARRLLAPASAVAAALLLALSPFHVRFAQEARMYTLLTFNAALALLALAHLLTGDRRLRWWVVYVLFSALALLSHNTAVLLPIAVNAAVGAVAALRRPARATPVQAARGPVVDAPPLRAWLWAHVALLLLWSPWLPSFVQQARAVDSEFWIQPPTLLTLRDALQTFVSAYATRAVAVWVAWGVAAALLLAVAALARRPALLALLVLLVVTPFALELLVSLRRPIFYDRTLLWTTVPLFVLLAAGLAPPRPLRRLPRVGAVAGPLLAASALIVLLAGNLRSLQAYFATHEREQWREAAAFVAERAGEGHLLLFNATWVQIPFDYYFDRYGLGLPRHGAPVDLFDAGVLEPRMTEAARPALRQNVAEAECVWLVYSHDWYADPLRIVPALLREEMQPRGSRRFVGLELQLYARRGGAVECGTLGR